MSHGERISQLRDEKNITQSELAELLGVSRSTIANYEVNNREPNFDLLLRMSDYFNCSLDYLLGRSDIRYIESNKIAEPLKTSHPIPILGTIRAGIPILASDNFEGELDLGKEFKADFALYVHGDSMSWAGIHQGDIALLRHTEVAHNGDIVAAGQADGDWTATLKYYIKNNGSPLLRAANPDDEDIIIDDRHRIIGVVVHVIKDAPGLNAFQSMLSLKKHQEAGWDRVIETAASYGMDADSLHSLIVGMRAMMGGKK